MTPKSDGFAAGEVVALRNSWLHSVRWRTEAQGTPWPYWGHGWKLVTGVSRLPTAAGDREEGEVVMNMTRLVGVVLLVGGIVLIVVGIVSSDSLANTLSSAFRGRFTQRTMWYIFGGIASAVVGSLILSGVLARRR